MLERTNNFFELFFSNRGTTISKIVNRLTCFKGDISSMDGAALNNYRRSKNVLYDDVCM